jgi:Lipase (class 3)
VSAYPPGFNAGTAAVVARLAQLATLDTLDRDTLFLPRGWQLLQTIQGGGSDRVPTAQGFYAHGTLDGKSTVVLAIGLTWTRYLNANPAPARMGSAPPAWLPSGAPPAARLDDVTNGIYEDLRADLWDKLGRVGGGPLVVTGVGLGAPLAQLAALDLLPGRRGPNDALAPATDTTCYAFSAAPMTSPDFAGWYGKQVNCWNVWAAGPGKIVDFWPTEPPSGPDYARLGVPVDLGVQFALNDDPWVERDGDFYVEALGGAPERPPAGTGSFSAVPPGFDQTLAFALAQLCAVPHGRRQHGDANQVSPPPGFVPAGNLACNDVVWGTLFTSDTAVVAAFRGPVTWAEFNAVQVGPQAPVDFPVTDPAVRVAAGLWTLYTAGGGASIRTALAQQLPVLSKGRGKVYLAGHDAGGALANLAAADLANSKAVAVNAVYTFGAPPAGNYRFTRIVPAGTSYQVARPGDFAPRLFQGGWYVQPAAGPSPTALKDGYEPDLTRVRLDGTPKDDTLAQHALTGYEALLNPFEPSVGALRAGAGTFFANYALDAGVAPGNVLDKLPPLDAPARGAPAGAGQPSGARADAAAAAAGAAAAGAGQRGAAPAGAKALAVSAVHVQAGQPLVLRAPDGGTLRLVVGQLSVDDGGEVRVEGSAQLHVAQLDAAGKATLSFAGAPGAPPAPAAAGAAREDGTVGPDRTLQVGFLSGRVRVLRAEGQGGGVAVHVGSLLPGASIEPEPAAETGLLTVTRGPES